MSDGAMVFVSVVASAFFVVGAVPLGYLADRYRRAPIIGVCSLLFSAMVFLSGFVVNAFMLFWVRFGAGIAKANTIPVHNSLLADTYPVTVRGRIGGTVAMTGRAVAALSPLAVGAIAVAAGGVEGEGWRWAFYLLGIPVAVVAVLASVRLNRSGSREKRDVLASATEDADVAEAAAQFMRPRWPRTPMPIGEGASPASGRSPCARGGSPPGSCSSANRCRTSS
jgi:MFS family permease